MPGLFDNNSFGSGGGLLGLLTGQGAGPGGLAGAFSPGLRQEAIQQQQLQATHQALIQAGVPAPVAAAAALNPELLKQIAPAYLDTAPKLQETGTDPFTGQKSFATFRNGQNPSITAAPIQAPGGGRAAPLSTTDQMFNNIEQQKAQGAPPEKLLENVPNSLRNAVDAMIKGKSIPGNFSMRGQARDMAVRLAHAIDPTFDETLIPQRQAFARGMGQTSPSSNGGQKILLNTALQHGAELADALEDLHNTNGPLPDWLPGSGPVANFVNRMKNTSTSQGGAVKRVNETAARASGEVGKLYSGSAGGGETERLNTARDFSQTNTPAESAGALEAFRNLIFGKMNALQTARDQVYGSQGENVFPILDPQTKKALDKIDQAITRLKGGQQPQQSTLPQGWSVKVR